MICNGDPVFFLAGMPGKELKMEKEINRGLIRTGETDIKVHLIDSFPNHPYHVFDDEDMTELAASIEANGLLNPIIVRSKADGRYELISGHRRKRAYEILKINKIRSQFFYSFIFLISFLLHCLISFLHHPLEKV